MLNVSLSINNHIIIVIKRKIAIFLREQVAFDEMLTNSALY